MEDAQRRLPIHRLPIAGIALPFLLAVAFHVAGPRPRPIAAAPSRPALAFDQYLVDRGRVSPSEEIRAHFDFTNRGRSPVTNIQLVPSCGCLQPRLNKPTFEPGETGNFVVRVQTANQNAGPKEYTVAVTYRDPEPREAVVTFRVDLPENQVFVRPPSLSFYEFSDQASTAGVLPKSIEIVDRRGPGQRLNILDVECTPRIAEVEVEKSEVDADGFWHAYLKVSIPGRLPERAAHAVIHIATDDPAYRRLRVPLILQGGSLRKIIDRNVQPASGTRPANRKRRGTTVRHWSPDMNDAAPGGTP